MIPTAVVSASRSIDWDEFRPFQRERRLKPPVTQAGLDRAGQIEAADAADRPAALGAFPRGETNLRQQRSAGDLALRDRSAFDFHDEFVAAGRLPPREIGRDRPDPRLGMRLIVRGIADLPPDRVLVVDMRRALALQPRDLALQPGLAHQAAVARRDRLGHGELIGLTAFILQAADGAVAGQRRLDEPRLALVVLPHRRVHRAERGIGVNLDLFVLIALPLDAALALLDLARQPRHVEMMQRLQPLLHIDAGAHRLRRADQHPHAPGAEIGEQPLLVRRLLVVLHERDLAGGNAARDELLSLIQR